MRAGKVASFGARCLPTGSQTKQRPHIVQGEAEFPRAPHEPQPANILRPIAAIAASAARRWHQADTFVVADRLDVAARSPRKFADRHGVLGHIRLPQIGA
jgi:hypothetical protein